MSTSPPLRPLLHTRILSLALNLPGPAALLRCRDMGADCTKLEPPPLGDDASADPMAVYCPPAYAQLHDGIRMVQAHLKTEAGQAALQAELNRADVLITSFRPSALAKLGLAWDALHARHPQLSLVRIVGAPGDRAEEPGHDLTYLADAGLLTGNTLPPTLYADMGGALLASEAVLQVQLARAASGEGACIEVALSSAADWLAYPRRWGLTQPSGDVGGAHAGYQVYACADGRVAVAALEPHFAARLLQAAGLAPDADLRLPGTHSALAAFMAERTCSQLDTLAATMDIPLHTLPQA